MNNKGGKKIHTFAPFVFFEMKRNIIFILCASFSIALIIGGFFVPPMGVIDGSVLQAVGLLLAFGAVAMIPDIISSSKSAKVTTAGGTIVEINTNKGKNETDGNKDI